MTLNSTEGPKGESLQAVPEVVLREYEKIKLDLAGLISDVITPTETAKHLLNEGRELLARLAEGRFNVAVVGRFSRGKTSLMNAVLGTDRLPTGILPLTSVLTMVRYGSSERVLVYFGQSSLARRRYLLSDEEWRAHLHGLMLLAGHRRVAAAGIETEDLWRG